ncbi:Core-2/I-Branching enzyme [Cooperia oncophora]
MYKYEALFSYLLFMLYIMIRVTMKKTSSDFSYASETPIETINLDCTTVFNGGPNLIKYKRWTFSYSAIEKELYTSSNVYYLSGADLPLRTNLEMVRIMKALNGSINTDVEEFEIDRYRMMEGIHPPVPLYKSAMSVAIPRRAADFMSKSKKVKALLTYLSETWVPDESFWTSVAGNAVLIKAPGSFRARDILWLRKHLTMSPPSTQTVENVGTSYIGRYQVWEWQKPCKGRVASWSCVFGVQDMWEVVRRPELVAHKLYLDQEPAAYLCLLKVTTPSAFTGTSNLLEINSNFV